MIKLIASDIDGTLVGKKRKISDKNIEAIRYALNKGVHFAIASGRAYDDITPVYKPFGLECQVIAVNGAKYYDETGKELVSYVLNKASCLKVIDLFEKHNLHYMLYTSKGTVTHMNVEEVKDSFIKRKVHHSGGTYEDTYNDMETNYIPFRTLRYEDDLDAFLSEDVEIHKVEGFDPYPEKIDEVKPFMKDIDHIAYLSSFNNNMEVTNDKANKGDSLLYATKLMGIKPEEVLVLGDAANDMSMFEIFENSAAVANATDEIKAKAKYQVASCDDDGVAEAIYKLI